MKKLLALLLAAGLPLSGGCKKDSKTSGPSKTGPTTNNPGVSGANAPAGKKVTLKLTNEVTLDVGKPLDLKIEVLRGPEAKGDFTLTFKPEKDEIGLKVNPQPITIKPGDKDVTVHLSAGQEGATNVTVSGQGADVTVDPVTIKVNVNP